MREVKKVIQRKVAGRKYSIVSQLTENEKTVEDLQERLVVCKDVVGSQDSSKQSPLFDS